MIYKLHQLAAGSYDLALDGIVIGSVVRDVVPGGNIEGWRAELLHFGTDASRPIPFTKPEHDFDTLAEVRAWLGDPEILDEPNNE